VPQPIEIMDKVSADDPVEGSVQRISKVSCGAYHTAAVTNQGQLYVWGSCAIDTSVLALSDISAPLSSLGKKVNATPLLEGVAATTGVKEVACCGVFTLATA
jgi:alpha-tubulin suppressor-like RCC1 family protein